VTLNVIPFELDCATANPPNHSLKIEREKIMKAIGRGARPHNKAG
jgi:hypothetical protein